MLAKEVSHAHSTAYALTAATWVHIGRRDPQATQAQAEELIKFTTEQGFPYWLTQGNILWGWAAAQQGQEEGLPRMRQHLSQWQAMATETVKHAFLGLMADVCWKRQQTEEGLALVDGALVVVEKTGECFYEPELYRLKGQLTLQQSSVQGLAFSVQRNQRAKGKEQKAKPANRQSLPPNPQAEAEACFHKAIEIARQQQAKSLELRAAMSLAQLWQSQGKKEEAHEMLAEIYGWFTEGFDTKDLQEAKALLEELE
ncbi:MAG TPA: hypothetical protein VGX03_29820 [Candidatus Binatia bacterium]|nr:hypothetical protein [Candidatus Binatia bacterium]